MNLKIKLTVLILIFNATANAQSYRLGATLPLSGDLSSYGRQMQTAIELAKEDLEIETISTSLFIEDVPTPGISALTALKRSLSFDKKFSIVANFFNPNILVMEPLIKENNILTIHSAAPDDQILKLAPKIIAIGAPIKNEVKQLVAYAINSLKAKNAGLLSVETSFSQNYRLHSRENFVVNGGRITIDQSVPLNATDMDAEILRIVHANPEILFCSLFGPQLGRAIKRLREYNYEGTILAVYEAYDPVAIAPLKNIKSLGNIFFFIPDDSSVNSKSNFLLTFNKRFLEKYKEHPSILALNGYQGTMIAAQALNMCSGDTKCSNDIIYKNGTDYQKTVNWSFNNDHEAIHKFKMMKVIDGDFEEVR